MRFFNLPPSARLQIWSRVARLSGFGSAARPRGYSALLLNLLSLKEPLAATPGCGYATVSNGKDNGKKSGKNNGKYLTKSKGKNNGKYLTKSKGKYLTKNNGKYKTKYNAKYNTKSNGKPTGKSNAKNDGKDNKTLEPSREKSPDKKPLHWDGVEDVVRDVLDRQPEAIPAEKEAMLANLQWCVENKTQLPRTSVQNQFLGELETAISADDPIVEMGKLFNKVIPPLQQMMQTEQYAHVTPLLFQPASWHAKMNIFCDQLKLGQKIQADIHPDGTFVQCRLHFHIPGMADEQTFGKGLKKIEAKESAWTAMLVKLDTTGALSKLLSLSERKRTRATSKDKSRVKASSLVEEIELVNVEESIMKQEKDGLADVFNYAAKFGLVPRFETRMLKRRVRGGLRRKPRTVREVSIRLPEQNIEVVAYGITPLEAEITAVLAFKRAAEQLQVQSGHISRVHNKDFGALNTETAFGFVKMVWGLEDRGPLEFMEEEPSSDDIYSNTCQLMFNGNRVGRRVVARSKRTAEQLAYLTAAVELARKRLDTLSQYAADISQEKSDRSKILGSYPALTMAPRAEVLDIMKTTLSEAGQAGLSEYQQSLTAISTVVGKPSRRLRPQETTAVASKRLFDRLQRFEEDTGTSELRLARSGLPMSKYSPQVLDIVSNSVYSIVVGATGSGKTTQVPQIILDAAIRRSEGGSCNVICTQPRRLAATSVARRVATERGERLGQSVGYQVRGDSKLPQLAGSITYCTTGLLLERLKWDADDILDNATHLVIDEVHEREIAVDFLLIVLKKAITARQLAGKAVPKVVLMSATMDTELFSAYLPNDVDGESTPCPSLDVPGRTFPVKEKYLGEILNEIVETHGEDFLAFAERDKDDASDYLIAERAFERADDKAGSVAGNIDWKQENQKEAQAIQKEGLVPIALLVATIAHICTTSTDGAILAFLPGLQEITATEALMKQSAVLGIDFANEEAFRIHLLHSSVPADEQRLIFDPIPTGCRRIILSTNIAETSVTVPDVKHVVDLGKLRQNTYAHERRVSALQTVWESESNARQRAGRAGRVSGGNYYALYSRKRRKAMPASELPELLRADLQATCLSIKAQGFQESVSDFLSAAIEPPPPEAVQFAVANLKAIEAFTKDEEVTALGGLLAKLPVPPALGRMILLGLIFRCLDPMIILATMHSERPLFVSPPHDRALARALKQHFNVANSDHMACLEGFQDLRQHARHVGEHAVPNRAKTHFLHLGAFRAITHTAKKIGETLVDAGLLDADAVQAADPPEIGGEALNRNSRNVDLIKCLLLAGFYPNIGVRGPHVKRRSFRTASEQSVAMHPSSVNAVTKRDRPTNSEIFAFSTLARGAIGGTLFMRDSSLVTPLATMLFGGRLRASEEEGDLIMDEWLPFKFDGDARQAVDLIVTFRNAKDRMLNGVFTLLADPNESAKAVDVMDIVVDGVVRLLDADAEGREGGQVLYRQSPNINGDVVQEAAWAGISQLYRSNSVARME